MTSIKQAKGASTPSVMLPDGYQLHHIDCLGSTNDEATQMARQGAPSGTVVMADRQTNGRGRLGRRWVSPLGNFYASIVLRLDCDPKAISGLSLLAGVALGEALSALGPVDLDIALKWPNDILIGGAKTAGLLLESAGNQAVQAADFVVIGTGVNINSAPDEVAYPVTCLAAAGFGPLSNVELLRVYIAKLEIWLDRWHHEGFSVVRRAWCDKAYGLGEQVSLRLSKAQIEGIFVDLTERGALLIEQPDGRRREISAGDVMYSQR